MVVFWDKLYKDTEYLSEDKTTKSLGLLIACLAHGIRAADFSRVFLITTFHFADGVLQCYQNPSRSLPNPRKWPLRRWSRSHRRYQIRNNLEGFSDNFWRKINSISSINFISSKSRTIQRKCAQVEYRLRDFGHFDWYSDIGGYYSHASDFVWDNVPGLYWGPFYIQKAFVSARPSGATV